MMKARESNSYRAKCLNVEMELFAVLCVAIIASALGKHSIDRYICEIQIETIS